MKHCTSLPLCWPCASSSNKKPIIAKRWIAIGFATLGTAFMYILRYNLSVAIVAMVLPKNMHHISNTDNVNLTEHSHNIPVRSLPIIEHEKSSKNFFGIKNFIPNTDQTHYDWNDNVQGLILSSYFYGYIILQIAGGRLSEKYGAKWILAAGVALPSVLTFFIPFAADCGPWILVTIRVLIGLLHSTVLSTGFAIISVWMPEEEKSQAAMWLNIGLELGGMISLLFTGWACSFPALGWRAAMYLAALFCLLWFIPFVFFFYSRPEDHPTLSNYEKKIISQSRLRKKSMRNRRGTLIEIAPKLCWKTVLTSKPVWANCSAKFTGYFGYYVITTKMPAYLDEVYDVPISQNGLLSALSFTGILCAKLLCIRLAPTLQKYTSLSLTNLRKCFQVSAMIIAASSLLLISLVQDSLGCVITLIVIAMFGMGLQCGGETPQLTDFAQDLSGTIFGFCNMFLSLDGILAPFVAGEILEQSKDVRQGWNLVFNVCAAIYLIGAILFIWLADSTPQKWSMPTFEIKDKKKLPSTPEVFPSELEYIPDNSESFRF